MAAIETFDLSYAFRNFPFEVVPSLVVLDKLNLGVKSETFVSIVGPSGCGKTTLLRLLDGLLPPTAGQVRIDGVPIDGPGANRAMVFQEYGLLPWRSVVDNIAFGLELRRLPRRQARDTALRYIRLVGLEGFESNYPHQLSGGMKQRVGLARALSVEPDILLMDEPFGSLDAQTRELMQIELMKIWETAARTVVFITHDIDEAIFLSDRVLIFSARPSRLIDEIEIAFPRPRWELALDVKADPRFITYKRRIWEQLRREQD